MTRKKKKTREKEEEKIFEGLFVDCFKKEKWLGTQRKKGSQPCAINIPYVIRQQETQIFEDGLPK